MFAHVFGYASLVALPEQGALPGCLRGYRRYWGVAMDNWDAVNDPKHFVDPKTGERPHIRVAYLDIEPIRSRGEPGAAIVNGLAIPVDAARLAALDEREVNYERIDVTHAFQPPLDGRVFTYVGTAAARERCAQGRADADAFVSRDYVAGVRAAFAALADDALAEFDRTTDPLPFPERDLGLVQPPRETGS